MVTLIFALTAPRGTVNWSSVGVLTVIAAAGTVSEPILTTGTPVTARRLVPVTVTTWALPPTGLGGVKPVIFGSTLKIAELAPTPAGVVTLRTPVRAPGGTMTVALVAVTGIGVTVTGPLKVTALAPVRLEPVITTVVPTAAGAGTERTRGTDWTVAVWVPVLMNP